MRNNTGCLYRLTAPNGKAYIGITINATKRWWTHNQQATKKNSRAALHEAIRKHGFEAFKKEILVVAEIAYLKELEQKVIEAFGTRAPHGYNLTAGGEGMFDPSPEVRNRMRLAQLGTKRPQEVKDRIGATQKGRIFTAEHRARISEAMRGRVMTEAALANLRTAAAKRQGIPLSSEVRAKISSAHSGEKNHQYGKPGTWAGKTRPEETRRRISEGIKAHYAAKRAAKENL